MLRTLKTSPGFHFLASVGKRLLKLLLLIIFFSSGPKYIIKTVKGQKTTKKLTFGSYIYWGSSILAKESRPGDVLWVRVKDGEDKSPSLFFFFNYTRNNWKRSYYGKMMNRNFKNYWNGRKIKIKSYWNLLLVRMCSYVTKNWNSVPWATFYVCRSSILLHTFYIRSGQWIVTAKCACLWRPVHVSCWWLHGVTLFVVEWCIK